MRRETAANIQGLYGVVGGGDHTLNQLAEAFDAIVTTSPAVR
ncbi:MULTISPECIES: hypothetical protein [unclassified Arthrobacter]|nr:MULTISPECIES: hypothetical protein [unclassified Arthrobacter]